MLAQTSWSQNETGLTQSDHATWFTLPSPVLTTAVRFEGKRTTPPSCNVGLNGADYRGAVSTTGSGLECQMWTRQEPHTHVNTPALKPLAGLGAHNYCRNPTEETGPWCYTMDPSVRWEYCSQIPDCSPPAQPPPAPSSPSPPCFGGGNESLEVLSNVTLDTDASPDGFNFSSLVVAAGATLRAIGSNPLIIHAEAFVDIQGSIDLSGGTGGNSAGDHKAAGGGAGGGALKISAPSITIGQAGAIHADGGDGGDGGGHGQKGFEAAPWSSGVGNGTGGVGVAGGGAGGDGAGFSKDGHAGIGLGASAGGPFHPHVPPGAGGAGHAFAGPPGFGKYTGLRPAGGAAYGDAQLTGGLQGGSGGGGGGNDVDNEEGAGGGGSGGTIYLVAVTLRIEGTLTAKGGLGGRDDYHYNGGTMRECCNNGGPGSVSRIRLDYETVTLSGTVVPPVGHTSALDSDMLSCLRLQPSPPSPPPALPSIQPFFRLNEIDVTGCAKPPPPPPPPPQCFTATDISAAANCTQSRLDDWWGGGSFDCSSALLDGLPYLSSGLTRRPPSQAATFATAEGQGASTIPLLLGSGPRAPSKPPASPSSGPTEAAGLRPEPLTNTGIGIAGRAGTFITGRA